MIRKELRKFYGPKWRKMRARALALRGHNRCDVCRQPHRWINWAHLSGDPRVPGPLAWLCPSCHSRNDTKFRIAATRRMRAKRSGQLWLTPEMELAAVPARLWPAERRQMDLFGAAA